MKKLFLLTLLACTAGFAQLIEPPFTKDQVDDGISDSISQLGAGGWSTETNVTVLANTWTDVPASFTVPYASGFDYVSGSTIVYTNGTREFLFMGSCSLETTTDNGALIQVGIETNGVFVAGSSSGERSFAINTAGSLSYNFPLQLMDDDTVGLVIRSSASQTIGINTWQSAAIRF